MGRRAQLVLATALMLAGCVDKAVVPDSEAIIALKSVKSEWLRPCEGLGPRPGDDVGALKQDQADTAALGAICRDRHNSFVDYIGPVIQKVKGEAP